MNTDQLIAKLDEPPDAVWMAAKSINAECCECGGSRGHTEIIHTGDDDSMLGWELWFCCHECQHETFHRIHASDIPVPDHAGQFKDV